MHEKRTRVLIVGGGFGGVYTAIALEKLLKKDPTVEVGLINKENYLVFQPMLPEVISGSIGILDTIAPIRRLCPNTNLYTRQVEAINLRDRTITTSVGFRPRPYQLEYDHLVIAVGNVTSFAGQLGLAEHALPFKYLGDALVVRNHVIHVMEEADIEADPELRRALLTFVVLHPVQSRLNLELNSWSPRSIICVLDNRRLIEPLAISYFVFLLVNLTAAAGAVGKVRNPAAPAGFPSIVGKSAFWIFPRSAFFHSSLTHELCYGANYLMCCLTHLEGGKLATEVFHDSQTDCHRERRRHNYSSIGARSHLLGVRRPEAVGMVWGIGYSSTMAFFTSVLHIPALFAFLAIAAEFFGGLGLILGLLTRVAAFGIFSNMVVAVAMVHHQFGFFMNWTGAQEGEGYEYHLLVLAVTVFMMIRGAGRSFPRPHVVVTSKG